MEQLFSARKYFDADNDLLNVGFVIFPILGAILMGIIFIYEIIPPQYGISGIFVLVVVGGGIMLNFGIRKGGKISLFKKEIGLILIESNKEKTNDYEIINCEYGWSYQFLETTTKGYTSRNTSFYKKSHSNRNHLVVYLNCNHQKPETITLIEHLPPWKSVPYDWDYISDITPKGKIIRVKGLAKLVTHIEGAMSR